MKDNARQDQGSTRSLRTALSRPATPPRRFQIPGKSTYKTQTKCIQNRGCCFIIYSASTTYNFTTGKYLHFLMSRRTLSADTPISPAETRDNRISATTECCPLYLGER